MCQHFSFKIRLYFYILLWNPHFPFTEEVLEAQGTPLICLRSCGWKWLSEIQCPFQAIPLSPRAWGTGTEKREQSLAGEQSPGLLSWERGCQKQVRRWKGRAESWSLLKQQCRFNYSFWKMPTYSCGTCCNSFLLSSSTLFIYLSLCSLWNYLSHMSFIVLKPWARYPAQVFFLSPAALHST